MFRGRLCRAVRMYLRSTTLHGFKYLDIPLYLDRVGWLVSCCAGVCGAAVLCTVLWTRFHHAPLLLSQIPISDPAQLDVMEHSSPLVAVCPAPFRAAQLLAQNLSKDLKDLEWLSVLFSNILRGKSASDANRLRLDRILETHNLTLTQALMDFNSPCEELMRKCQWQSTPLPCNELFGKELTRWGACCVMRAERQLELKSLDDRMFTTERLDLNMDCYVRKSLDSYCCEFFVKYPDEDWLGPWYLMSGYSYTAQMIYTSIKDSDKNKLVNGGTCVSTPLYSQSRCKIICQESQCGCSHPLRLKESFETNIPPPCSVMQMKCLGNFIKASNSCNCLPACQRITAYMSMEANEIIDNFYSYNPIYQNVNSKSSIVLKLRIRIGESKSYDLLPTETWLTLLSSLGGVFNMFMGVGLFSLLEFLNVLLKFFLKLFCRLICMVIKIVK